METDKRSCWSIMGSNANAKHARKCTRRSQTVQTSTWTNFHLEMQFRPSWRRIGWRLKSFIVLNDNTKQLKKFWRTRECLSFSLGKAFSNFLCWFLNKILQLTLSLHSKSLLALWHGNTVLETTSENAYLWEWPGDANWTANVWLWDWLAGENVCNYFGTQTICSLMFSDDGWICGLVSLFF